MGFFAFKAAFFENQCAGHGITHPAVFLNPENLVIFAPLIGFYGTSVWHCRLAKCG